MGRRQAGSGSRPIKDQPTPRAGRKTLLPVGAWSAFFKQCLMQTELYPVKTCGGRGARPAPCRADMIRPGPVGAIRALARPTPVGGGGGGGGGGLLSETVRP